MAKVSWTHESGACDNSSPIGELTYVGCVARFGMPGRQGTNKSAAMGKPVMSGRTEDKCEGLTYRLIVGFHSAG